MPCGTGLSIWRRSIETLQLAPVLDLSAAATLQQQLLGSRGSPITVDASKVERLGGLCLQVLLAARASWAADRRAFVLEGPSQDFHALLKAFGLAATALTYREE